MQMQCKYVHVHISIRMHVHIKMIANINACMIIVTYYVAILLKELCNWFINFCDS